MKRKASATLESIYAPRYCEMIGDTPLIDISSALPAPIRELGVRLLGKAEFTNPGMSLKDRIVKHILDSAEREGKLKPGGTVIAASSGNTGCSTAMLCAQRGYKCIILTSPKCSKEKQDHIKAFGAEIRIMESGYDQKAAQLAAENGWFDVDQYENLDNSAAHYGSLGPEIYLQTRGQISHFVSSGSTGGHVSGIGRALKNLSDNSVHVTLVDPDGSVCAAYFQKGGGAQAAAEAVKEASGKKFLVEGAGKTYVAGNMRTAVVDDTVTVGDTDSFRMCDFLARTEGVLVGGSSGLNVSGALIVAKRAAEAFGKAKAAAEASGAPTPPPPLIVTVLCDSGVKYLSKIYNEQWREKTNTK